MKYFFTIILMINMSLCMYPAVYTNRYNLLNSFYISKTDIGDKLYFLDNTDINFRLGSYGFDRFNLEKVKQVAMFLQANPNAYIIVEGHSDYRPFYNETPNGTSNVMLSYYRALAFSQQINEYGANLKDRLIPLGYGYTNPKYTERDDYYDHTKNRRLEFIVVESKKDLKFYSKDIENTKKSLLITDYNTNSITNNVKKKNNTYKNINNNIKKYTYRQYTFSPEIKIKDAMKSYNINTLNIFQLDYSDRGISLQTKNSSEILFNKNSYSFDNNSDNIIQYISMFLDVNPDLLVIVEGHSFNESKYMSYKRSLNFLQSINKYGNYTNRIIALGYEEQFIKNTNRIKENRRLKFKIIPYSSKYAVRSYISKVKKKYNPIGVNTVNFNIYK
ncbi:OmpA family protein [Brachyspira murdochii]|uniref:OmpA family protein n=1 Tax=Brachyspira murdochii TaxID=84378 RepID=UPI0012F50E69|nr:OmpA family protein [Brachyspira murdochii]